MIGAWWRQPWAWDWPVSGIIRHLEDELALARQENKRLVEERAALHLAVSRRDAEIRELRRQLHGAYTKPR